MHRRKTPLVATTLLFVSIAIVGVAVWREDGEKILPLELPKASPSTSDSTRLGIRWTEGARQRYDLSVDTTVQWIGEGGSRHDVVDAILDLRVLAVSDESVSVVFSITTDPDADETSPRLVFSHLDDPFVVVFAPDGNVREARFEPGVSALARQQLEECIRTFQIVIPEGADSSWTTEESHVRGHYTASYTRAAPCELVKRKQIYAPASISGLAGATPRIEHSSTRARLRLDTSWLDGARVEEKLVQSVAPGLEIRSRVTARLTRRHEEMPEVLAIDTPVATLPGPGEPAKATAVPAGDEDPSVREDREPTAREVAAFRDLFARFDTSGGRERSAVFDLRRLLQRSPELASLVRELIDDSSLGRASVAELFHLLEVVGTPEAQAVLRDVAADPISDHQNRLRSLIALGGVREPMDASIDTLWQVVAHRETSVAVDASNTASLALGRLGSHLRTTTPDRYQPIRDNLVARLHTVRDRGALCNTLTAVGNTYDETLARDVVSYLRDDRPLVRQAAAAALGALPSNDTGGELIRHLPDESDGGVRSAVVESLRRLKVRGEDVVGVVRETVRTESDPQTRFAMARFLIEADGSSPQTRAELERMMAIDGSRRIRGYLARELRRAPGRG